MATYQENKLQEIANAIRKVEHRTNTYKIKGTDFASEILKLDPSLNYNSKAENGYYGLEVEKCAATYLLARITGKDKFAYHTYNIFSPSLAVRYGEYGRIDCSAFVGLCLRGITYENSPYASHSDSDAVWTPSSELVSMYGTNGWEYKELDMQKEGVYNDIGISGYSTIRSAADLGRFFYKCGNVLYDSSEDGTLSSVSGLSLQAGDLVFWDTSESEDVDARFMSISHIAIVAENTSYYYHVTGKQGDVGQLVVWYTAFGEDDNHPIGNIVLVVRPDYRPRFPAKETPIGVNLLHAPWTYSRKNVSDPKNGITVTIKDINTIVLDGTATANTTIRLKDFADSNDHITLSAGTYELTGIPSGFTGTSFALQVRDASDNDFSTQIRYPTGSSATNTFTLTEETNVTVRLYVSEGKALSNVSVVPTLIRIA